MKTRMTALVITMAIFPLFIFAQKSDGLSSSRTVARSADISSPPALQKPSTVPRPEEAVYRTVSKQPLFPDCASQNLAKEELEKCSDEQIAKFISENMRYPSRAIKKKVEGTVIISFVVEKNGVASNAQILNDIGAGCGKEARRIVESMPKWTPGKRGGKTVRTRIDLPIDFNLE